MQFDWDVFASFCLEKITSHQHALSTDTFDISSFFRLLFCFIFLGQTGFTPLHWSAVMGFADIAKSLLKKGANINAKCHVILSSLFFSFLIVSHCLHNLFGKCCGQAENTALVLAVANSHTDVINVLLEKGASVKEYGDVMVPLSFLSHRLLSFLFLYLFNSFHCLLLL